MRARTVLTAALAAAVTMVTAGCAGGGGGASTGRANRAGEARPALTIWVDDKRAAATKEAATLFGRENGIPVEEMVAKGKELKSGGKVSEVFALPVGANGDAYHSYPLFTSGGGGDG